MPDTVRIEEQGYIKRKEEEMTEMNETPTDEELIKLLSTILPQGNVNTQFQGNSLLLTFNFPQELLNLCESYALYLKTKSQGNLIVNEFTKWKLENYDKWKIAQEKKALSDTAKLRKEAQRMVKKAEKTEDERQKKHKQNTT
jgi:hypothetical protein